MTKFAAATSVSSETSKTEIERTVRRYGATGFTSGWQDNMAAVGFVIEGRKVRFRMQLPDPADDRFCRYLRGSVAYNRDAAAAHKLWEQACRQKWRALALVIKAKLEAVDAGISIVQDEFLANIVMSDGRTVGETIHRQIALEYETGKITNLMPDYSS